MKNIFTILAFLWFLIISPSVVLAADATLALSPSTGTFNKGCAFSLNITLDTGGTQTDGTDAIVFYDSSRLTANSINAGTIYADYPGNNIDSASGKIMVSGLASVTSSFSGQGTLATINFTVKEDAPTGVTQVKFDFDPSDKTKTTDSNVVKKGETPTDILGAVTNGNYTVGSGSCGSAAGAPASVTLPATGIGQGAVTVGSTPSAQIPIKTLPEGGTQEFTFMLAILGSALTVLGILGLALL